MPVLLVLFPLGSEVRQFSHSGLFSQLLAREWKFVVAAAIVDDDLRAQLDPCVSLVPWPSDRLSFWARESATILDKAYARRLKRKGKQVWKYVDRQAKNRKQKLLFALEDVFAFLAAHIVPLYAFFTYLELLSLTLNNSENWHDLITSVAPDAILTNVARASTVPLALFVAGKIAIPTVILYHTWKDTEVPTGRLNHRFTKLGVWNDSMGRDLIAQNPTIDPAKVAIVGCAHFDCVGRDDILLERAEVCSKLGLDPEKRIILYTASAPWVVPEEERYIGLLYEFLKEGLVPLSAQILVRTNPMDDEHILAKQLRDIYPAITIMDADWRWEKKKNWCFQRRSDFILYNSILHHASVNVSIPSTVTIECAISRLPVINIGFDMPGPTPLIDGILAFWNSDHYSIVRQTCSALLAKSPEELIEMLCRVLENPEIMHAEQDRLVKRQLGVLPPRSVSAGVELIESVLRYESSIKGSD